MSRIPIIFILLINLCIGQAQSIKDLYTQRNYKELIKFEDKSDLTELECYFVGFAFFQLENDEKAIKMYDKAISLGLDDAHIYLYKGLALQYSKQYDNSIETFHKAIERDPKGQKIHTELANTYLFTNKYDSALKYFYLAREQSFQLGDPYDKIPYIYHIQKKFDKALEEYYISASLIDKNDPKYIDLLKNIGLLEYTHTKNYHKSIKAYSEMLSVIPEAYDLYPKLIKAYYAAGQYSKGDSIFNILKDKYERSELSKDMMDHRRVMVDEFTWNGQKVDVVKHFDKPQKFADPIYQFFLIDKSGKNIERKFLTEKTDINLPESGKHILCGIDKDAGMHYTYPIGWKTDDIDYKVLKGYILDILNNKMKPQASSNSVR